MAILLNSHTFIDGKHFAGDLQLDNLIVLLLRLVTTEVTRLRPRWLKRSSQF